MSDTRPAAGEFGAAPDENGLAPHIRAQIRRANRATYDDGRRVATYVQGRYHAVRRQLTADTLAQAAEARPLPPGPLLEIGASGSSMLGDLSGLGRTMIAADIALTALHGYKRGHITPACLDAGRPLPFRGGSLAAVVASELIEHLLDPFAFLREVHRVLAPGGVLALTTPNLAGPQDRLRFLFGHSPRQIATRHEYLYLHIHPYTAKSLSADLKAAGLRQESIRSNYVGWELRSGRWLTSRWLAARFPSWGGTLIVAARKP